MKEKNLESNFFQLFGLRKVKTEKKIEEKCEENLSCYEQKILLSNMRGK